MALDPGHAFEGHAVPDDLTCPLLDAVDVPGVWGSVLVRIYVAKQAVTKIIAAFAADGGCHKDSVAPDHRARVREPGNRCLPENVRTFGCIPTRRCRLSFGNASSVCASERRPVLCPAGSRETHDENDEDRKAPGSAAFGNSAFERHKALL